MSQFREDFLKALAEYAKVKAVHMIPRQWSGGPFTEAQISKLLETTLRRFKEETWIDPDFIRKDHTP